jgi:DNA primase
MKFLSESTIQKVKGLDIVSVIGQYLNLKAKGGRHTGPCPFHNEKTPSFSVNATKQIFKCFGCGAAGDAIGFVMRNSSLPFLEAVEEIASKNSIAVEYAEQTEEQKKEAEQARAERKSLEILLQYAADFYQANELPVDWIKKRKLQEKTLLSFKAGFTPNEKNIFVSAALGMGYTPDHLVKAGLVREHKPETGNPVLYDYFQDRILLPIHDYRGKIVAFTGRLLTDPDPEAAYQPPKYLNSPDSVWTKGDHLYGLNLAIKAIQDQKFAYLVEGNIDVQAMHQKGKTNTVAPCGTGLTENQVALLKRFTDTVCIIPDHDAAGLKALKRNAELFIKNGFYVQLVMPDFKLDPDEQLKKLRTPDDLDVWFNSWQDYISGYLVDQAESNEAFTPKEKVEQVTEMGKVLELIQNEALRQTYYSDVCAKWPGFGKVYKLQKRKADADLGEITNLEKENRAEYFDFGYFEEEGCYWTFEKKQKVMICNFTIQILYFVLSENEPKYVCIFRNMFGKVRIAAISTDDFTGVGTFKKAIGKLGAYIFDGSETHLNKIKMKLFHGVKEAVQPRQMGFNPGGNFYTWANGIYFNADFIKSDKYGVVTLRSAISSLDQFKGLAPESQVEINGDLHIIRTPEEFIKANTKEKVEEMLVGNSVFLLRYYYLPFSTSLKLHADDDDNHELERMFRHFEKPGLSFENWAKLIVSAYGKNGRTMILFYLASLYRDIIYKENMNYFPILYHFGLKGSGKSKAAESLAAMFGEFPEDGVSLEGGSTATGIRRYMASVRNGLIWLNEYKNDLPNHIIGMLKGIADGSGKMTGRATGGNETKNYKPLSAAIICGQDLPTKDPALFSRTLTSEFSEGSKTATDEYYEELKQLEKDGFTTSVTCEMLNYRDLMKQYRKVEREVSKTVRNKCKEVLDQAPMSRLIDNVSSVLAPFKILSEQANIKFPFTWDEIFEDLIEKIKLQVNIQAASDDVEQYFLVLQSLIGREIFEGEHYKIQREADGITKLFLRTKPVHNFYLAAASRQGITQLGISTVRSYLEKHQSFIENREKGVQFSRLSNTTSAVIFNYDMLRRQGIEFKSEMNLKDMKAEDDPSATISKKIKLGADVLDLVAEFVKNTPTDQWLNFNELHADFNQDLGQNLPKEKFIDLIANVSVNSNQFMYDFSDNKFTQIKFKGPF